MTLELCAREGSQPSSLSPSYSRTGVKGARITAIVSENRATLSQDAPRHTARGGRGALSGLAVGICAQRKGKERPAHSSDICQQNSSKPSWSAGSAAVGESPHPPPMMSNISSSSSEGRTQREIWKNDTRSHNMQMQSLKIRFRLGLEFW
ncbi:unnamed protein product [Arctogadus glacialis]